MQPSYEGGSLAGPQHFGHDWIRPLTQMHPLLPPTLPHDFLLLSEQAAKGCGMLLQVCHRCLHLRPVLALY
jgi:hypothetical protein